MTAPGRVVLAVGVLLSASSAEGYRPFDSTDADVVERGEVEIELGPVGYVDEDGTELLATPDLVVNVGVHPRLELVVEGRGLAPLERDTPERRYRLVDTAFLAKGLVRRGSLQGETGPSLALELGALLPTLDLAFRYAREDGSDVREIRAGLTWIFDWTSGGAQ